MIKDVQLADAIDLSTPRLMGIVNVTPDSFSDHGAHFDPAVRSTTHGS